MRKATDFYDMNEKGRQSVYCKDYRRAHRGVDYIIG